MPEPEFCLTPHGDTVQVFDAPAGATVYSAVLRLCRDVSESFYLRHNDLVMYVPTGMTAEDADAMFARERNKPNKPEASTISRIAAGGITVLIGREHNTSRVAETLRGHRLDTLSQDSGHRCTCGADSRDQRAPWSDIDEHRAHVVMEALMGPVPKPEPMRCTARFIVETLADPEQDERMKCTATSTRPGPLDKHQHRNADGSLRWQDGAEVSIKSILDSQEA